MAEGKRRDKKCINLYIVIMYLSRNQTLATLKDHALDLRNLRNVDVPDQKDAND